MRCAFLASGGVSGMSVHPANPGARPVAGFTLLEIMVALAVLALALTAGLRAGGAALDNQEQIRHRQLADWVAQDRLNEHHARRSWLPVGTASGETWQGGVRFRWEEHVSGTPNTRFRRIEVRVYSAHEGNPGDELARIVGFLVRPG